MIVNIKMSLHCKEAIELHVHTLAEDGLPLNGKKDATEMLVSMTL